MGGGGGTESTDWNAKEKSQLALDRRERRDAHVKRLEVEAGGE